jgi:hypothetical protein
MRSTTWRRARAIDGLVHPMETGPKTHRDRPARSRSLLPRRRPHIEEQDFGTINRADHARERLRVLKHSALHPRRRPPCAQGLLPRRLLDERLVTFVVELAPRVTFEDAIYRETGRTKSACSRSRELIDYIRRAIQLGKLVKGNERESFDLGTSTTAIDALLALSVELRRVQVTTEHLGSLRPFASFRAHVSSAPPLFVHAPPNDVHVDTRVGRDGAGSVLVSNLRTSRCCSRFEAAAFGRHTWNAQVDVSLRSQMLEAAPPVEPVSGVSGPTLTRCRSSILLRPAITLPTGPPAECPPASRSTSRGTMAIGTAPRRRVATRTTKTRVGDLNMRYLRLYLHFPSLLVRERGLRVPSTFLLRVVILSVLRGSSSLLSILTRRPGSSEGGPSIRHTRLHVRLPPPMRLHNDGLRQQHVECCRSRGTRSLDYYLVLPVSVPVLPRPA